MLTGVAIYALFLIAKELDETYRVVDKIQTEVYDILGVKEQTVYKCEKKKKEEEKKNETRKLYFPFGEDLDDYGDDNDSDDDFLEHRNLDEEQQKQEDELNRILKEKSRNNGKNEENVPSVRRKNANKKNTKKKLHKEVKQKHQLVGNQTGAKEKLNVTKLRRRKKIGKCTRGREKRHKVGSNDKV